MSISDANSRKKKTTRGSRPEKLKAHKTLAAFMPSVSKAFRKLRFRNWAFSNRLVMLVLVFSLAPLIGYGAFSLHLYRQNILQSGENELRQVTKSLIMLCEAQEALDRLKKSSRQAPDTDAVSSASPSWIEGNEYKSLKTIIAGVQVASTGYAYVFNSSGRLVIHPTREGQNLLDYETQAEAPYLKQIRDRALNLPVGVIQSMHYQPKAKADRHTGQTRIESFGYFKPYDWIVVVGCDEDELIAPFYQARKILFLLMAGVSLIVGASAFFISKGMMAPIVRLTEAASRIAHGDYPSIKPLGSKDEIGKLTGEFNSMVHRLQQDRIQKLIEWNKELEKRVEERTSDYQKACSHIVTAEKLASLGKISAMVAHELNNPMSGILSYSKYCEMVVNRDTLTPDNRRDLQECLEMISREAERCGQIVNNLLLFAKKSFGEFDRSHFNLVIEQSLKVIDHSLKVNEIVLEKKLCPGTITSGATPTAWFRCSSP